MLRADDFRDIEATEAQHRWWHNRAIHNAYGIARGLGIALETTGKTQVVSVAPGLAYDGFSRELMLPRRQIVALPSNLPSIGSLRVALVIRYAAPPQRSPGDGGACFTEQCVGQHGTVEFTWCRCDLVTPQRGVALGELLFQGRGQAPTLPPFAPMRTRGVAMPALGSGTTVAGNTPWDPWAVNWDNSDAIFQSVIGVQTVIDTSAAGFSDVPAYFAWLEGPLWNPYTRQLVPAIFPSLADEAIDSFTFRLWLSNNPLTQGAHNIAAPAPPAKTTGVTLVSDAGSFASFARQQGLWVSWVGCQKIPPKINLGLDLGYKEPA